MASASSPSTDKTQRETPSVPISSTGATQVTPSLNLSQSVARVYPIVTNAFGNSSLQPSALVIPSGTAYDYENYPKLVSICWPVIIDQTGNSVVTNVGPSHVLAQATGNDAGKTVTPINHENFGDRSTFRWDRPVTEAKDTVIRTPGMKAPIRASYNGCELQTEANTRNANGSVYSSCLAQQLPTLVQPCGCPIHVPSLIKRPRLQEIGISGQVRLNFSSTNGHFNDDAMGSRVLEHKRSPRTELNHGAFGLLNDMPASLNQKKEEYLAFQDKISRDIQTPDSEQPTVRQIVGNEATRIKPLQVSLRLPEDNKQGTQLQGVAVARPVIPENKVQVSSFSGVSSCQAGEPGLEGAISCGTSNNVTTGPTGNNVSNDSVLSSSVEVELIKQNNTVSSLKDLNTLVVVEADAPKTAVQKEVESFEGAHVFVSAPSHSTEQSSGCSSTVTAQPSDGSVHQPPGSTHKNLETGNKEEIVRDLITRIRYIKSRLNRAECEQRKKKMLRTILGLQKRVKALAKGMKKERKDSAKDLEFTSEKPLKSDEVTSGQELREENHHADSKAMDTNNCESRAGNVIIDEPVLVSTERQKGKRDISPLSNTPKPTTDISKAVTTTNCTDQQHCGELTITSLDSATLQNDARNKEPNGTEELTSLPPSGSNSGNTNMTNENNRQHGSGIASDGSADIASPVGIGLDSPPGTCAKRSLSSSVCENEFQRNHFTASKKTKRLSLSEEDVVDKRDSVSSSILDVKHDEVDAIDTFSSSSQCVSSDAEGVTQHGPTESMALNEKDYEANVLRKEIANLATKYEGKNAVSFAINFQDVTHDAQGVTQEAGVSEASLPHEVNKVDTDTAEKELRNFSVNGNESEHGVTNVPSRNDTQATTRETDLAKNEDNEEQISLSFNDTQNGSGVSTQDTKIVSTEEKRAAKPGLEEEVGEDAHSLTYQDGEKDSSAKGDSNTVGGIYDYGSLNCNESNFVSEDVELEGNLQSPHQARSIQSIQDSFTQEIQDIDLNNYDTVPWDDNENDQELFRLSLEASDQDQQTESFTESFTSPVTYNPISGEEDVDLMQSFQIRQARILNLTQKRDRLFNLVMNRL